MEALKLKIFDVLTEKITVSEFENWLYSSEYMNQKIKGDSLFFNVVIINYREAKSIKELQEIASEIFSEEELLVFRLFRNCLKIANSDTTEHLKKYVLNIITDFDFDNDLDAFWEFYDIYYSFDGYDYCEFENIDLHTTNNKTKKLAISVIDKVANFKNIEDIVNVLKQKKEEILDKETVLKPKFKSPKTTETNQKSTFKQKFLAFFKKI